MLGHRGERAYCRIMFGRSGSKHNPTRRTAGSTPIRTIRYSFQALRNRGLRKKPATQLCRDPSTTERPSWVWTGSSLFQQALSCSLRFSCTTLLPITRIGFRPRGWRSTSSGLCPDTVSNVTLKTACDGITLMVTILGNTFRIWPKFIAEGWRGVGTHI